MCIQTEMDILVLHLASTIQQKRYCITSTAETGKINWLLSFSLGTPAWNPTSISQMSVAGLWETHVEQLEDTTFLILLVLASIWVSPTQCHVRNDSRWLLPKDSWGSSYCGTDNHLYFTLSEFLIQRNCEYNKNCCTVY